jgi:hypothetical protein
MPRPPRTAEQKEKRNRRDRERREKQKQLAEKEQERKEQSRLSSRRHYAKKRAERAAAASRIAMSSPLEEPSPGVQSPRLPHHCRPRTPLSGLNPMQLLSNESMERLIAADHIDSVVINNSVNTLKDVLKEAFDLVQYKAKIRERREEAHRLLNLNFLHRHNEPPADAQPQPPVEEEEVSDATELYSQSAEQVTHKRVPSPLESSNSLKRNRNSKSFVFLRIASIPFVAFNNNICSFFSFSFSLE